MQINNSAAVLQAAIEGQGVALARSVMAHDDLAAGRLVRLFPDIAFASELAYYIVFRPERAELPKVVAFRDWLKAEAANWMGPELARFDPGRHGGEVMNATALVGSERF